MFKNTILIGGDGALRDMGSGCGGEGWGWIGCSERSFPISMILWFWGEAVTCASQPSIAPSASGIWGVWSVLVKACGVVLEGDGLFGQWDSWRRDYYWVHVSSLKCLEGYAGPQRRKMPSEG